MSEKLLDLGRVRVRDLDDWLRARGWRIVKLRYVAGEFVLILEPCGVSCEIRSVTVRKTAQTGQNRAEQSTKFGG